MWGRPSRPAAAPPLTGEQLGISAMASRSHQEGDRAGVWLDQTGCITTATQGQRTILGGSDVPATRGGLRPDPPREPAQPAGGAGMKRAVMGARVEFSAPREGKRPIGIARSADRTSQMAPALAGGSGTSTTALGWDAISAAS